jgi:hypothetical protein
MKRTVVLIATLLLSFGLFTVASAQDDVDIQVSSGDTLWMGEAATLDIYLANSYALGGMSLGFQCWSPDGALWAWNNVGGYGTNTGCVTLVPNSRIDPNGDGSAMDVFDMTGMLVTEQNYNTTGRDTIMCGGVSLMASMATGPLQHMYSYHIIPNLANPDDVKTLCFDSCFVPPSGAFVFVNTTGQAAPPTTLWMSGEIPYSQGGRCYPVKKRPNFCPIWDDGLEDNGDVNHCGQVCIDLSATDPEGNDIMFAGSHDGAGNLVVTDHGDGTCTVCYTPDPNEVCNTITIVIDVWDAFHPQGTCDPWIITKHVSNTPPVIDCGDFDNPVGKGNQLDKTDITCTDADACDNPWCFVKSVTPTPDGPYGMTGCDFWFATTQADGGFTYTFEVCCTDGFDTSCCTFEVEVLVVEPWKLKIEKVHDALQGHYVDVDICLNKGSEIMGGFDLLIAYDASALAFIEATLGDWLIACGWEYFTYRFNWNGNCGNACPSGLIRLVGMAETNNGPNHPDWGCLEQHGMGTNCYDCGEIIITLTFFLSNDRTLECMFVPIRFYWMDCGDNTISTVSGDTLALARYIYDYVGCSYHEIQDYTFGFPGFFGPPDWCLVGDKVEPVRFLDLCNGGVDIVCADSIDARGDINVNGIANEIADAVMFTNYFISGLSAFGNHVEASIAASDVNADGIALSVADLVYLVRVIIGDANPYPKPIPNPEVELVLAGDVVSYNASVDMGAALLTFHVNGDVTPLLGAGAASMDMKYAQEGNELRVLVYNIGSEMIAAGENVLITVPGAVELTGAEVATYDGFGLEESIRNVPREFATTSYPNPFNPKTTLSLNLPVASDWSIRIYNVAGQLVKDFSGYSEAGTVNVVWNSTDRNGTRVASGIYFYKAEAGQFSATKKMVLMK